MAVDPLDPTGALAELFQVTGAGEDMSELLGAVVHFAKRRLPGADEAAITLIRRDKAATAASTGGVAVVLDELQYDAGYGPCLDAGRRNEILLIADAATDARWPRYLPAAVAQGLGSSMSLPIPVENHLFGALNLYSLAVNAFDPTAVAFADGLALHLCAALSRAEAVFGYRTQIEQLHRAMESRGVIEQAKGILMVQRKCTAEDAFAMLRTVSMNRNLKLADLAGTIVAGASGHPVRAV